MPAPKPAHGGDRLSRLSWKSQESAMTDQLGRITIDPDICHGKPTIRGLRYPVEMVLEYATQLSRVQRVELLSA
jgi:hypothetical protein